MQILRIVANLPVADPASVDAFYGKLLGLDVVMDHGWLRTYAAAASMRVQLSFASEGGSGTPVPDLSIEVDDLQAALDRARKAGIAVEYGPVSEPWGVRRFYVRDPAGNLVNILQHAQRE
ncbi:glyoxalase [Achromobacter sp. DMS1]|uniref:VOC family protein n=1 Tax=Achromobacter sp. DMS1 TaxID=1688405 RepID=UPI00069F4BE2|nr:VOC family protein [Achromobacter sp. DMS1]KOF54760.1 glyoxalase [Achromobacter sp. DMS1]